MRCRQVERLIKAIIPAEEFLLFAGMSEEVRQIYSTLILALAEEDFDEWDELIGVSAEFDAALAVTDPYWGGRMAEPGDANPYADEPELWAEWDRGYRDTMSA